MLIKKSRKIMIVQQKNLPQHLLREPFVHIFPWYSVRHRLTLLGVLNRP